MRPKYPARRGGVAATVKKAVLIPVLGVVALILLCAVGFGILSAVLKPADYQKLMAEAAEKATGLHLVFHDEAETTFFPNLGLKTGKLTLSNPNTSVDAELLSVESASASLSLGSLLRGTPEVEEILLSGLNITLTVDPTGRNNWSPAGEQRRGDAGPAAVPVAPPDAGGGKKSDGPAPAWSLKRVACKDIHLAYRDLREGGAYSADIDTFTLTGLKEGEAAPLVLSGRIRDDAGGSTLAFRLKAALEMRGRAGRDNTAEPSLYLDVEKLELEPTMAKLRPIAAELGGKTEIFASGAWKMNDIRGTFTLPGDGGVPATPSHFTAEAAYSPGRQGKRRLEGELALDNLDIDAAMRLRAPAAKGAAAGGGVQGAPNLSRPTVAGSEVPASAARAGRDKDGRGKRGADGDAAANLAKSPVPPALLNLESAFTVTADRAVYGKIAPSGIRCDLTMQDGKADLAYSLTLFKGQVAGRAALDLRGAEPVLALNAALRNPDMDLADASPAFSDRCRLSGKLKASVELKCKGGSVDVMLHNLNGKASVSARDGEVGGFSLAPDLPGFVPFPSSFAYRSISASAAVTQGEAFTKDISLISNTILARGGGTVHIAYGQADLGIDFMTAGPPPGPAVPVSIRGPLHALSYGIDTRTLLRNAAESAVRTPEAATDMLKKPGDALKGLRDGLIPRR
jgi:AsmA protein